MKYVLLILTLLGGPGHLVGADGTPRATAFSGRRRNAGDDALDRLREKERARQKQRQNSLWKARDLEKSQRERLRLKLAGLATQSNTTVQPDALVSKPIRFPDAAEGS